MMGGAHHRFSKRYIVVILGCFKASSFFGGGDIERSINVRCSNGNTT